MTKKVNELLTAKTTAEYFKVCAEIANELEHYSITASNIFYQLHNNGLVDIKIRGDVSINFIVQGINKDEKEFINMLKWINDKAIIIKKQDDYIIIKVVL